MNDVNDDIDDNYYNVQIRLGWREVDKCCHSYQSGMAWHTISGGLC